MFASLIRLKIGLIIFLCANGHWRRQLWGTGARAPLDFQLAILGSLALQTLTSNAHGFLSSRAFSGHRFCRGKFKLWGRGLCPPIHHPQKIYENKYGKYTNATRFLRNFYQFLAHFLSFFAHSFPEGVIIVPKMPERSPINFSSTRTSDSGKKGS